MGAFEKMLVTDHLSDADYQAYRYQEIDNKTGELIFNGFTYANKVFSMSENAQRNLVGAYSARDSLQYPVEWNTKDDSETYQIQDATEMKVFYLTALATKKAHQDSGTVLKRQVRTAVDRAAMEAIVDNR